MERDDVEFDTSDSDLFLDESEQFNEYRLPYSHENNRAEYSCYDGQWCKFVSRMPFTPSGCSGTVGIY